MAPARDSTHPIDPSLDSLNGCTSCDSMPAPWTQSDRLQKLLRTPTKKYVEWAPNLPPKLEGAIHFPSFVGLPETVGESSGSPPVTAGSLGLSHVLSSDNRFA